MSSFINYILESAISLGALSLVYLMFLRNETFFKTNRLFLLFAIVFSSVLPLLHFKILGTSKEISLLKGQETNMLDAITVNGSDFSNSLANWLSTSQLIIYSYFFVTALVTFVVLFRLFQLIRIIRKEQIVVKDGINYVYLNDSSSPFSFLDYLFVSRNLESTPGWEKMLAHESEHIRQGHTVDILIVELISILQWFNPFFWLLRRVIKENHEYMADQAVLKKGVRVDQYKDILITQFVGTQFSISNNFNSSLIKLRLKMMTKIKSPQTAKLRYLAGILMVAALVFVFACENKENTVVNDENTLELKSTSEKNPLVLIDGEMADMETMEKLDVNTISSVDVLKGTDEAMVEKYGDLAKNGVIMIALKKESAVAQKTSEVEIEDKWDDVFNIVEDMPEFPGGEEALRRYIARNVSYPDYAKKNGIQGKVYVSFVVEKDGSVGRSKVVRGVAPSLDAEALRVMKESPKWTPGKQRGQAVAVSYTVPINFALE